MTAFALSAADPRKLKGLQRPQSRTSLPDSIKITNVQEHSASPRHRFQRFMIVLGRQGDQTRL
jgi:hypothetical protein